MNDAAVHDLWEALGRVQLRVTALEMKLGIIDARIRARLKEEAESRKHSIDYEWEHKARLKEEADAARGHG